MGRRDVPEGASSARAHNGPEDEHILAALARVETDAHARPGRAGHSVTDRTLSRRRLLALGLASAACELGRERTSPSPSATPKLAAPSRSSAVITGPPLAAGRGQAVDPHARPSDRALMRRFPRLAERLPWVTLAKLPTPIQRASQLEQATKLGPVFAKRDDLSSPLFGGGKPRKLELLLGEALARGFEKVVTFGGVGSNQALATAVHGRRLGLRVRLELAAQPPSEEIESKLLAMLGQHAELAVVSGVADAEHRARAALASKGKAAPWVIPAGGTSPLGNLAFADAALELAEQVQAGALPEPDAIYVAAGTLGSAVGLCLGAFLGGLRTQVVAVRASTPSISSEGAFRRLYGETIAYARRLDPSFPAPELASGAFRIDGGALGTGYGRATPDGRRARQLAAECEGWELEDTYTAKALAALIARRPAGVSVFWLTQSAVLPGVAGDYADLPAPLARYRWH